MYDYVTVVLTAYDRVDYFRATMESWKAVRNLDLVSFVISLEPSSRLGEMLAIAHDFRASTEADVSIEVNDRVLGVLHHPWVAMTSAFEWGAEYVIRAEDDILVSDDVLEFMVEHGWVEMQKDPTLGAVLAHTMENGPDDVSSSGVGFDPWLWATTRDLWERVISPTWDHDYSTYNGVPGKESGWDWNLNTRVFPQHGLQTLYPLSSRALNIGIHGVHGTPDNHRSSESFKRCRGRMKIRRESGYLASFQGV